MNSPQINIDEIFDHTWDYEVVTIKRMVDQGTHNTMGEPNKSISTISANVVAVIDYPVPMPYYIEFAGITQESPAGLYQLDAQNIWFKSARVSTTTLGVYRVLTSNSSVVIVHDNDIIVRSNEDLYQIEKLYDWFTHFVGSIRSIT